MSKTTTNPTRYRIDVSIGDDPPWTIITEDILEAKRFLVKISNLTIVNEFKAFLLDFPYIFTELGIDPMDEYHLSLSHGENIQEIMRDDSTWLRYVCTNSERDKTMTVELCYLF